jgi:hypothetical protein
MKAKSKIILILIAICLFLVCAEAETPLLQMVWSGSLIVIIAGLSMVLNHIEKKEETK